MADVTTTTNVAPLAALAQTVALGLPFVISGGLKSVHDLTLWRWFRQVPLPAAVDEPM